MSEHQYRSSKSHISVVFLGEHRSGKSTLAGNILSQCGVVSHDTIQEFENETSGLDLDELKEERAGGITMDITMSVFETPRLFVTAIDVPGHRDYTQNTLTGTSMADCAILVISAAPGEFEAGIASDGQFRRHALQAFNLGVKQLIVAINKMDSACWSQHRGNEILRESANFIKKVGYNPHMTPFVFISGEQGVNVTTYSDIMSWWKGWEAESKQCRNTGRTLIDAIDSVTPPTRPTDKPLRLSIQDVYDSDSGTVVVGRVQTGVVKLGVELAFAPTNIIAIAGSIEFHGTSVLQANPGDIVSLDIGQGNGDIRPGHVAGNPFNDPPRSVESFISQITILEADEIRPGYTMVLDCHTAHVPCEISLLQKIDRRSGKVVQDFPELLKSGDAACVRLFPLEPICVETFKEFPALGRLVLRDMHRIIAVGVVLNVDEDNKDGYY